ncbi:uncharacterized protein NPIL_181141 [Nephila pilipes]|uniref:Uncharacterized protein n=1 Tax=Nephila pilipes TaxID=299642 RepID=A0A8X6NF20_NEPPI|nr:uncharacterized protein NPIL_181141 [Nephila pilipes]
MGVCSSFGVLPEIFFSGKENVSEFLDSIENKLYFEIPANLACAYLKGHLIGKARDERNESVVETDGLDGEGSTESCNNKERLHPSKRKPHVRLNWRKRSAPSSLGPGTRKMTRREAADKSGRRLRALDALGENTHLYGRILAPKILRAFPHDICRNRVVYAKPENLAEGDITKLMKCLDEEVEGAVAANNIKDLLVSEYSIKFSLENINFESSSCFTTRPSELQAFESPSNFIQTRGQVQFQLSSIWGKSKVNIIAFESLNKYASQPPPPTDVSRLAKNKQLKLVDPDDSLSNLPIQILISPDFYCNSEVSSEPSVKLSDSLIMVPSSFGCILSGTGSHAAVSFISIVHNINVDTSTQALEDVVREFWSLESIGIQPIQEEKYNCNSELMTNFHQSFEIIDGRQNYIDKKQVAIVSHESHNKERLSFLPHHAVKKITNDETKYRIDFDASSHSPGQPSLSDVLEIEPNRLPDIMATLLRFRFQK